MEILETIVRKPAFGTGRGADMSDNLDDMTDVEKFIFNLDTLKVFATLDIPVVEGNEQKGKTAIVTPNVDVPYKGDTVGGLCHSLNKGFVAGQLPFYARPYAKEGKTHTTKKGIVKKVADAVKVQRTGDEFDTKNYACIEAARPRTDDTGKPLLEVDGTPMYVDHEEPTEGMRLRAEKWLKLHEDELTELGMYE